MHWGTVSWNCPPASLSLSFHFSKAHSALYHICSTIIFTSPHPQTFLLTLFPHSTFCCWESFSGVFEFGVSVAGESSHSFPPFLNCSTVCIFKQLLVAFIWIFSTVCFQSGPQSTWTKPDTKLHLFEFSPLCFFFSLRKIAQVSAFSMFLINYKCQSSVLVSMYIVQPWYLQFRSYSQICKVGVPCFKRSKILQESSTKLATNLNVSKFRQIYACDNKRTALVFEENFWMLWKTREKSKDAVTEFWVAPKIHTSEVCQKNQQRREKEFAWFWAKI